MGKTPKPLSVLVHPDLADTPEVKDLGERGHTVVVDISPPAGGASSFSLIDFDLIIGPNCWQMDKDLLKYLEVAIKSVRGIKYPKGKKK